MNEKRRFFPFYRVHYKLGLIIFSLFMLLILSLGLVLYPLIVHFYFNQVVNELVHRGHSHADVLSRHFDEPTLRHVEEMERNALTAVVVVGPQGKIFAHSDPLPANQRSYLEPLKEGLPGSYRLVESDWRDKPYLVAKSPVVQQGDVVGTVIMFTPTEPIRAGIASLQKVLTGVTLLALLASAVLIFLIMRIVTRPLIRIKEAIGRLAANRYDFVLPVQGRDEIAEVNRSLYFLANELQHYRQERQEFLAEISHELRTPTAYIQGYADLLAQNAAENQALQQRYIRHIQQASERLKRFIDDLFELIQLDQVNVRLEKKRVDLVFLVEQVAEEVEESFREAGLAFHVSLPGAPSFCEVDPERIRQVLLNLLENAKKYTPRGGEVEVSLAEEGENVLFKVRDDGMGIPQEEMKNIWQRFYRVEKFRSREHGGAGLGLAICKRIVELHGGVIEAQSQQGEGTVFTVYLSKKKGE